MKLLSLSPPRVSHEDLFLERYGQLRQRALALTGHDLGLAEDLLHDAFIQFTLGRPPLDQVADLDAYLGGMLRHMHASHVRRAARRGVTATPLDELEFLAGDLGSLAAAEAREALALLCRYACLRKSSSKAGSILILRFLLGYFPSEIASIARLSARAVDEWLRLARREARVFRDDPSKLTFLTQSSSGDPAFAAQVSLAPASAPDELLRSLRAAVFQAREGGCVSASALQREYRPPIANSAVPTTRLAHLVSCPACLERVNALLGLGSLSGRFPDDSGPSGGRARGEAQRRERRRRNAVEHRPEELSIAVNGLELARCTVAQQVTRQSLAVNLNEPMAFVEVFSLDGTRLLFTPIDPYPSGAIEQSARIDLSENRRLDVIVRFSAPWPSLDLVYRDPHWTPISVTDHDEEAAAEVKEEATPRSWPSRRPLGILARLAGRLTGGTRLALATAVILLVLTALFGGAPAVWAAVRDFGQQVLRALGIQRTVELPSRSLPLLAPTATPVVPGLSPMGTAVTVATPSLVSLEVHVLQHLDHIGALLGQEALVSRQAGRVVVQAYGADPQRRREIVRAVRGARDDGRLIVLLEPHARSRTAVEAPLAESARALAASASTFPVQPDVERLLIDTGVVEASTSDAAALPREARTVAVRVLDEARAVLLNVGVLRDVALRFTPEEIAQLNDEARRSWLVMGHAHARDIERAAVTLQRSLAPWLRERAGRAADASDLNTNLPQGSPDAATVSRLFGLATAIDEGVREAFAARPERPPMLRLTTAEFAATLTEIQAVARAIQASDPATTSVK